MKIKMSLSIMIDEEIKEKLVKLATQDDRTLSNFVKRELVTIAELGRLDA